MSSPALERHSNADGLTSAVFNVEVLDDEMAAVLQQKTPAERLAIAFGLWRSARVLLRGQLRSLHPDWSEDRLDGEVARRLSRGAV